MSTREIAEHLREIYGMDAAADLISTVTDAVLDEVTARQQRPLGPIYPLIFFDAIRAKIRDEGLVRNKAIRIALGVLNEFKNHGVEDILLSVVDGFRGSPKPSPPCSRR